MAIWLYVLQPFEILTLGNSGNATNATIKQTMQLKLKQLHWNNDITSASSIFQFGDVSHWHRQWFEVAKGKVEIVSSMQMARFHE